MKLKKNSLVIFVLFSTYLSFGQLLPPKEAYPFDIKQIHSGHSLTDPLFANWPGQYVNLIGLANDIPSWQLFDVMVGKSTIPGSSIKYRWENAPGFGAPDARNQIGNWEILSITERVPLLYQGGNNQQWYLDGIQEQKTFLSNFVNNAWNNGNNGNGAPTLLWTTWTNIDDSDGPWRQMLDIQGEEFERMQDYANENIPIGAPPVYIIPGHKLMARIYDDIQLNLVPGITNINQLFGDNIHTNSLGNYAIAMIHYACMFNESPVGLTNDLMPNPPSGFQIPSTELAFYFQTVVWEVVTSYPRTGITDSTLSNYETDLIPKDITIYPNPVTNMLHIDRNTIDNTEQIRIYNPIGKLMYSGNELIIDVSQFPSGLYILSYKTSKVKLVKQ